jgi:hypothetical protein
MTGYEYAMLVLRRLRVHRVTKADGTTEDLQDLAEPTLLAWFNTYVRPPVEAAYAEESRRWNDGYAGWRGQIAVNERPAHNAPWLVRYPDGRAVEVYAPDAPALEGRLRYEYVQTGHPEPVLPPHPNHYQEWVAASVRQQRMWFAELHTSAGVTRERHATPFLWYGVPVEPIVAMLNRLGQEGWQLVAASEDKGLYSGQDTTSESSPVVVRYTLMRVTPPAAGAAPAPPDPEQQAAR